MLNFNSKFQHNQIKHRNGEGSKPVMANELERGPGNAIDDTAAAGLGRGGGALGAFLVGPDGVDFEEVGRGEDEVGEGAEVAGAGGGPVGVGFGVEVVGVERGDAGDVVGA